MTIPSVRSSVLWFTFASVAVATACTSSSSSTVPDEAGADAGGVDTDASVRPDGAMSTGETCGDGTRAVAELCDSDEVACTTLSALYTSGAAKCRKGCDGYDVSACVFSPSRAEVVQPAVREPARWANAQCNKDGAFPLYVQRSSSKRWVIRLEGGGACSPAGGAPCYARPPTLTSPVVDGKPLVDRSTTATSGFSNVPADFSDANYVQLVYCSSDAWTGEQNEPIQIPADASGTKTMPFRFAGRANVRAALEILRQRYGLDDADPETRVFLQGGSAGGHGVLHNIDQLRAALPATTAAKRVWALANAASYFEGWRAADAATEGDWSARDAAGAPTSLYWEDVLPAIIASWKGNMGSAQCVAAFPGNPSKCFFVANLQPHLVAPPPAGLGIPVAIANNLEDPNPQDEFGIVIGSGGSATFAPNGDKASRAWGTAHAARSTSLRWAYMPRAPLGPHGVPLRTKGAGTPSLQSLMDAFVQHGDPDAFSFIDFAIEN